MSRIRNFVLRFEREFKDRFRPGAVSEERSCTCPRFEKQKGKENNRCSIFSAIFISQRNVLESTNNRQKIDHYCFQILTWPSSSEQEKEKKTSCNCVYETDFVPSLHWLGLTRFLPSIHPRVLVRTHYSSRPSR